MYTYEVYVTYNKRFNYRTTILADNITEVREQIKFVFKDLPYEVLNIFKHVTDDIIYLEEL